MGLLAIPRTAVRLAQPMSYPGQRPGAGKSSLGRNGAQVQRAGKRPGIQLADGGRLSQADATDMVVGRIEAPQESQCVGAG